MESKRIAVCLYDACSLYEITGLTAQLVLNYGQTIDYLASSEDMLVSEEGLLLQATKTFSQVSASDYDCILLTGTMNPLKALYDEQLLSFLSSISLQNTVVAAISCSPMFLAKAGLLKGKRYVGGIYENFLDYFDFLDKVYFTPQPVLVDDQVITAIGFATQEFTTTVLVKLGYETDSEKVSHDDYEEKAYFYQLSESDWKSMLLEIKEYETSMN